MARPSREQRIRASFRSSTGTLFAGGGHKRQLLEVLSEVKPFLTGSYECILIIEHYADHCEIVHLDGAFERFIFANLS